MATTPSWATPLLFNPNLNKSPTNSLSSGAIPKPIAQNGSIMDFNIEPTQSPTTGDALQKLSLLSNQKTDTSITPEVQQAQNNLNTTRSNILNLGKKQITKEDIAGASSLRPINAFEGDLRAGVDKLKDYSSGDSLVDRTIANRLLTQSGAMQSAANISQAQKIASNPMLSSAAKTAGMMEVNRIAGAQRSQLVGQLAQQAQERAYSATKDYAQLSLQAAQYNEEKYKTDLNVVTDQFNRELTATTAAGNIDIASLNNATDLMKTKISTHLQDVSNSIQANISIGNMTQEEARLAWDKQKTSLDEAFRQSQLVLQSKETDANITQMKEATASLHDGRIGALRTTAINSVSNLRMANPELTAEQLKEKGGLAYNQIQDAYRLELGDENATPTDDYINTMIQQARTPAEMESAITTDKLNSWQATLVGTGPNKMSQTTFNGLAQAFKTASLTNNVIHVNDNGTVDINNLDGTTYAQVGTDGVYRKASELGINAKTPSGVSIPPEVQKDKTKEWVSEDGTQVLKLDSSGEAIESSKSIVDPTDNSIVTAPQGTKEGDIFSSNSNNFYEFINGKPELRNLKTNPLTFNEIKSLKQKDIDALSENLPKILDISNIFETYKPNDIINFYNPNTKKYEIARLDGGVGANKATKPFIVVTYPDGTRKNIF